MGNDFPLSNIVAIRKELKKNSGEEHYHLDRTNKPMPYLMPGGILLHFFIILPFSCRQEEVESTQTTEDVNAIHFY